MVAARGGGNARPRHGQRQERVEGAAWFEGASVLEEFQLDIDRAFEPEIAGGKVDDRRTADVGPDPLMGGLD